MRLECDDGLCSMPVSQGLYAQKAEEVEKVGGGREINVFLPPSAPPFFFSPRAELCIFVAVFVLGRQEEGEEEWGGRGEKRKRKTAAVC